MKKLVITFVTIMVLVLSFALVGCSGEKISPSPVNIKIVNQKLTWSFNSKESYVALPTVDVTCGSQKMTTDLHGTEVDLTPIVKATGKYQFTLVAKSGTLDGVVYKPSDPISVSFDIEVLGVPSNLAYNHAIRRITWNAVSGASGYEVNINGNLYKTKACEYTLNNAKKDVKIKVKALGNGSTVFASAYCLPIELDFLSAPSNLKVENGLLTWDEVTNAAKYNIYINGQMVGTRVATSYKIPTNSGKISLQVKAAGNNVDSFDSALSNPISYNTNIA